MGGISWHKNLSVGIAKLDNQHKKLIEVINSLYDIIAEQNGSEGLEGILEQLAEYTQTHFATEEEYFRRFTYPEAPAHMAEHKVFIDKVREFRTGYSAGSYSLSFQMMDFLQDWLVHHIINTDKKYSDFLCDKGLR